MLLILSVGLLLLIGGTAYYFQKSKEEPNKKFANDLFQEFAAAIVAMNRELKILDEKNVFDPSVLSNKTSLEAEARKRIESQRIIEKFRNDLPHALDLFRQKAAVYNISDEQKQALMSGFEKVRPNLSHQGETICNLLQKRDRSELDFLNFMASADNEYELKDGKVFFRSPRAAQLAKSVEDSAWEVDAAIREWRNNLKTNIRELSQ